MMRLLLLASLAVFSSSAYADDDEHVFFGSVPSAGGVAVVNNDLYRKSCSACHFAYQPGLLPGRSWAKLMQTKALENHFGDNAEMSEGDRLKVLAYLTENGADRSDYKRSKRIMSSIAPDQTPIRITEVSYFRRKHHEVPTRMVTGNPKVKSWSNCTACHTSAEQGSYSERGVRIPGYAGWED